MDTSTLQTGDLILYNGESKGCLGIFQRLIKSGTHSNYTHIAMVLRDPTFVKPDMKGLYIWESALGIQPDPEDGETKIGVQITPIERALNNEGCRIFVRKVSCPRELLSHDNLARIHDIVHLKPYDIVVKDWVEALFGTNSRPQKTDRFWCSALVGCIYTECGILSLDTDWSILKPSDFSLAGENLEFSDGCSLEPVQIRVG